MGFIDGKFRKVSQDAAAQAEIERFHTVGVRYTVDAEVCRRQEGLKFIDFGVVGVREEIEDLRYYYLPYEEKFKLFYERVPELREDWRRGVSSLN